MIHYFVHGLGAVIFTFGCYYDWFYINVPTSVAAIMSAYGGKLKFLTYWNALLQAMFFTLCVVIDFGKWDKYVEESSSKKLPLICRVRDYIFTSLAFPSALFVCFTFWALYIVNRELVLPQVLDPHFPTWLNHIMHTCVGIWVLLEMFTSHHIYSDKRKGLLGLAIFQCIYICWMHYVYYKSGLWVYNIFVVLTIPQRIVFLLASVALGGVFYWLGYVLNSVIWGADKRLKKQKKKK